MSIDGLLVELFGVSHSFSSNKLESALLVQEVSY